MASFLTDLVKPYVEKLINGVITESSYVCCFTCIAKDFEDEQATLEVERTTFNQQVDVATRGGEDVQANALFWEEQAVALIQEDTKTKQKCFFGFCCHCIWRYRRGKQLANKTEQIKKLIETRKELAIRLPARLPDIERYSSESYIPFKSRESKCKELLDALNDENNYIVGLQGMGGTGKTTLTKEVGKELKRSNQFTHVIDTTVSSSHDIKKIQDDIAGPLGLKFDDCNESDRPKKLWSRLTNGEKILLILDDVWGYIDFNDIGIPHIDNHKGCRVLVTSRNLRVCNKLQCSKTIQLDRLSEEDAWIMFQRHAGLSEVSTKTILDKGRKIANECKGLPIAIAVIARSLRGKQSKEDWDMALKSLSEPMNTGGVVVELYCIDKSLKLCYDDIKNEETKRLFLMCSLFQKDEEIQIEMLTRFCIGAGLFGEAFGNYESSRKQVVISKNELLASGLLLEADHNIVKMHSMARDVAQQIANKEIQTIKLYDKNQKAIVELEKIKYLSCEGKVKDVFSCKLEGINKLEILIVSIDKDEDCYNVKIEIPNSFFENNTSLRVFHLFYNHYPKLPLSLPQSIQSLINIRSLLFTSVDLVDISFLGNLPSLETLDLKDCKIDELPHGIAKLEKFRLLNLEGCEIERNNPFEVIKECSSLEELYFTGCFNAAAFSQEITFPKLKRFCIDEFSRLVNESLSRYVSVVDKDEVFLSETTLKYCMQTAEVLRLRRIKRGWRNLIPEIVSMNQGMNDIVELSLRCISQLQYLVDAKHTDFQLPNVLSKLVVLELDRMENLEKLFNGPIFIDSLKNLEKLSIKDCKHLRNLFKFKLNLFNLKTIELHNCPMLVSLYQLLTSRNLLVLETLKISHCERLQNIVADERREEESREEIDNGGNNKKCVGSVFPKLKVLDIEGCPLLEESIFPFLFVQDLPVLQTIKIRRCDGLKYIFGQYQDAEFGSLRQLELSQLPNFIDMFCKSNHPTSLSEKGSSSASNYGSKAPLQLDLDPVKGKDTATTTIPLVEGDNSESNNSVGPLFPKLEVLDIEGCPLLEFIFPFLFNQDLPLIQTIKIRRCDALKYIFGQYQHVEFSSLRQLELCQLPNFIGMIYESNNPISLSEKGSFSTSNYGSKAQLQLDPMRCNIISWDTTTTTIPFCDSESNSYCLNIWERAQCLQIPSKILYNITKMELSHFSKLKSVFIPSIVPKMLLETLTIRNCDELKNIIDFGDYASGTNNWYNIFPKMKELYIEGCPKMEYIFGQYIDDHQNHVEIQLQLLELKCLSLYNMPSLVAMCPKHYRIIFPPLEKLELDTCSEAAMKSMSHVRRVSESQDRTIIKENGDGQIVTTQHINGKNQQRTSKINDDQDSQNDNAVMKVSLNIEVQFPKGFPNRTEVRATSKGKQELVVNVSGIEITSVANLPTNSKALLLNDKTCLVDQQHQHGEIGTTATPSQKYGDRQIVVASPPIAIAKPLTTQDVDNDQGESSQIDEKLEDGDDKIAMPSLSIATTETNDQVSRNDDAFKKESSNIEEQFPKDDDIIVSKSLVASQFPMEGDPSQK